MSQCCQCRAQGWEQRGWHQAALCVPAADTQLAGGARPQHGQWLGNGEMHCGSVGLPSCPIPKAEMLSMPLFSHWLFATEGMDVLDVLRGLFQPL